MLHTRLPLLPRQIGYIHGCRVLAWNMLFTRQSGGPRGRVVKVAHFIIASDHSIMSPLWLLWVRATHASQVGQVKFYLRVCQVVFPGGTPVFETTFWLARFDMSQRDLERDFKLNKKTQQISKKKLDSHSRVPESAMYMAAVCPVETSIRLTAVRFKSKICYGCSNNAHLFDRISNFVS